MREYNSISKLIKELLRKTQTTVLNNFSSFLFLYLILMSLLIGITLSMEWIKTHLPIYNITLSMILLRISLYCFWTGLVIGWIKILLSFIKKQKIRFLDLFKYYYLLPQVLSYLIVIYIIQMIPILFILYKFEYDVIKYGTDLSSYLLDLQNKLIAMLDNEISQNLLSAYFNEVDMIIFIILSILYYTFIIKYWGALLFMIDKEIGLMDSLKCSNKFPQKTIHIIIIAFLSLCAIKATQPVPLIFCFIVLLVMILWITYYKLLSKSF